MGLFKPAWQSRDHLKRAKAVAKLDDQKILADIARNDQNASVREEAIKKLTNTAVLRDIIRTEKLDWLVKSARERLEIIEAPLRAQQKNQLLDVAKHTDDQEELLKLLEQARQIDTKMVILERINDQQILMKAAERHPVGSGYPQIFEASVRRITDRALQMKLLCDFGNGVADKEYIIDNIRSDAITDILDEMDDMQNLLHVLRNAKSYRIRRKALEKIQDEQELMRTLDVLEKEMASAHGNSNKEASIRDLQEAIVAKINDPQLLQQIAFSGAKAARYAAIDKIKDKDVLHVIATQVKDKAIQLRVIEKINDQKLLSKLLYDQQDPDIKRKVMDKITKKSLLLEIVHGNADEETRKDAAKRLMHHAGVSRAEKDDLVAYILQQFGVMSLFTVVPKEQDAQYGLRREVNTVEMYDQYGSYDEVVSVEYYYNGERVG